MPTREEYERALLQAEGARSEAARLLGVHASCVHVACRKYGLSFKTGPRRKPYPEVHCESCGILLTPDGLGVVRHARRRFCSRDCKVTAQRGQRRILSPREGPFLVECTACGKPMERYATDVRRFRRLYCSTACRRVGRVVQCTVCGTEIWRSKSHLDAAWIGEFVCSRACDRAAKQRRGRKRDT
jgi:ribosomal protein S27E